MNALDRFFHGADTRLGIFYPKDYLLAAFSSFEQAEHVRLELTGSGFAAGDVLAAPGQEVIQHAADRDKAQGMWGHLMVQLSRLIDTEESYADYDVRLARAGAGFVAVYCPSEELKHKAWEHIRAHQPIAARHYELVGIEHLKGEA